MKILHVGNPEAFKNFAICNYFVNRGEEIHYFSPFSPKAEQKGIIYHYDGSGKKTKLGFLENVILLRRVIKAVRPDILHAHNVRTYGWMAALSGFSPLMIHAYGGDVLPEQMKGMKPHQLWLSRHTMRKADRLIVTGQHMAMTVSENYGIDPGKIKVISRGVDFEVFNPISSEAKGLMQLRYGIPPGKFAILSPRYLFNSVYNIEIILRAISVLKDRFPEILLIQMHNHGEGDGCFCQVVQLIEELGIKDRVLLVARVPNNQMAELYNISDLCISVPSSDGFPVTVLEAAACKVPLIISRLAYTSEWFENEQNGLVVEPSSVSSLISGIAELRENPSRRKEFGENNFRKVILQANYIRCMKTLGELYEEVAHT